MRLEFYYLLEKIQRVGNIFVNNCIPANAAWLIGVIDLEVLHIYFQVAVLILTEITPKSMAVHNPTEIARVVVKMIVETIVFYILISMNQEHVCPSLIYYFGAIGSTSCMALFHLLPRGKGCDFYFHGHFEDFWSQR